MSAELQNYLGSLRGVIAKKNAYKFESSAYNAVVDYFSLKDEDTTWIIPVLVRVSNDLRIIAERADERAHDINNKYLRESLNSLTRGFTTVAKDRTPVRQAGSKKLAIFAVTNVLFKIYFKVNTLQLCGKLINVVEGPGGIMDNLTLFPVSDVSMYKFYIGRLKMFEDRYEEARECLRFSLKFCPRNAIKNKQRILASLVPVEMCLGVLPGPSVSTIYKLDQLYELGQATKKGDIRSFEAIMTDNQASFVRIGVYLVLEQVKIIAYRNLIKRIHLITNSTRISLSVVETALKSMTEGVDLDEIECILSNLIFQGKIKGYMSHQKSFLILSKTEPFPNSAVVKKVA
eukprot:gene31760-39237_t